MPQNGPLSKASLFDNWSWQMNGTGGGGNSSIDIWTNWHVEAGQPNYDGNCARVLGYDYEAYAQWYDGNCDEYNYVICEKPVGDYPGNKVNSWTSISENLKTRFYNIFISKKAR